MIIMMNGVHSGHQRGGGQEGEREHVVVCMQRCKRKVCARACEVTNECD